MMSFNPSLYLMNLLKRMIYGLRRQWIVINSVAAYDRNRQAAGSSLGAWENLIGPAQMMAFFILMRVGFSFLRGNNRFAAGGSTDMYFNIIVFMSTGFCIAFLFRKSQLSLFLV